MNTKPVTPEAHGIIDYVFSGLQLMAPSLLRLNKKTVSTYQVLGASFLATNALTNTPAGLFPVLSFKGHQKADDAFLAGLAFLALAKFIKKDKRSLRFHFGFLAAAIAHYLLTNYNAGLKG